MSKEWNAEMAKTVKWIEENEQAKELFDECGFQYKEKAKQNISDNSHKLVTEYDKESFDRWMSDLIKRNGTTKY